MAVAVVAVVAAAAALVTRGMSAAAGVL